MAEAARSNARTVHFVRYLPDQRTAVYRRTADPSHARLSVTNVPANISDRAVEIVVNLTVAAAPFGMRSEIDYGRLRKNQAVILFPSWLGNIVRPGT